MNEDMEQGFGKELMDDVDKEFWSSQGVGSTMKKWFFFFCSAGDRTQGLTHKLSYIPMPRNGNLRKEKCRMGRSWRKIELVRKLNHTRGRDTHLNCPQEVPYSLTALITLNCLYAFSRRQDRQ